MAKKAKRFSSRFLALLISALFLLPGVGIVVPGAPGAAAAEVFADGSLAFSAAAQNGNVAVTLTNGTGLAKTGHFLLGVYDEAGVLVNLSKSALFTAPAGGLASDTFYNVFGGFDSKYTYKAFCWDEDYVPLADVQNPVSVTGGFNLVSGGAAAAVYCDVDPASKDYEGVEHAAANLAKDIQSVTGVAPKLAATAADLAGSKYAVISGTIGESPVVDGLIAAGKIDVSAVAGKWDSYVTTYVANPAPGVDMGLVIAGSNKRGAVYGLYKISETIGVSPFTFFADSVPVHRDEIILPAETLVQGEPSVKYRGLFINDERQLEQWMSQYAAAHNFTVPAYNIVGQIPGDTTVNTSNRGAYRLTHEFYAEFFDMILRQYGNFMWPAMWNNSFFFDDLENGRLANAYGVVVGLSHQEFMNCSDKEWAWANLGSFDWIDKSTTNPDPATWTYVNKDAMIQKWTQTMLATKDYETIPTLGLRGLNDTPSLTNQGVDLNVALLNDVTKEQLKIVSNTVGGVDKVPTNVIIYKEIEGFYNGTAGDPNSGWKASIDPNITVMFCDDNHGNVSFLPSVNRDRPGGYGMYYHFDYNGSPRSYRWVDSTPDEKIREQMTMAYDYGVQRTWIANTGSIKFNEQAIDYWFKLAYDVKKWGGPDGPAKARRAFAAREFGEGLADDVADIMDGYVQANAVRKPEILLSNTFSSRYWDEANRMLARITAYNDKALKVKAQIPPERMDAYYNLVLHPALVVWNDWNLQINIDKNHLYADIGVTAANDFANIARAGLQLDNYEMYYTYGMKGITGDATYTGDGSGTANNMNSVSFIKKWLGDNIIDATPTTGGYYTVSNGKFYGYYPRRSAAGVIQTAGSNIYYLGLTSWDHQTSQWSIGTGTAYNQVTSCTPEAVSRMCVIPQVYIAASGALPNAKGTGTVAMPKFTSYGDETRYFEVAQTGDSSFTYTAIPDRDWIVLSKYNGSVGSGDKQKSDRVNVVVDWSKVPGPGASGSITVTASNGDVVTVAVTAEKFDETGLPDKTFIENDNYISILSKDYAKSVPATVDGVTYQWAALPNYGRELSAVKVTPSALNGGYNTVFVPGANSPYLEYNVYVKTAGTVYIVTQWAPTNAIDQNQPYVMNYAAQVDDGAITQMNTVRSDATVSTKTAGWGEGVEQAVHTATNTNTGGARNVTAHTNVTAGPHTIRIYMVNDGLTLQKLLVGCGLATSAWNGGQTPTILAGSSTQGGATATPYSYLGPPESGYVGKPKGDLPVTPPMLTSLSLDGAPLASFSGYVTAYNVELGYNAAAAPVVSATAAAGLAVSITQAAGVPGTAKITVSSGTASNEYTVNFSNMEPKLDSISVGGAPLASFNPAIRSYNVELGYDVSAAPAVTAAAPQGLAVSVAQAAGLPGAATVTVSSAKASAVYTVNFSYAKPALDMIYIDGVPLASFSKNVYSYDLSSSAVPTVTADASPKLGVSITQAAAIPGSAVIKVSWLAETATYTVNFSPTVKNYAASANGGTVISAKGASGSDGEGGTGANAVMIDGDRTGRDGVTGNGRWRTNSLPATIDIGFSAVRSISHVNVVTQQPDAAKVNGLFPEPTAAATTDLGLSTISLYYYNGADWVLITTQNASTLVIRQFDLATPVSTDRIRVVANSSNGWARIVEIEAWGE